MPTESFYDVLAAAINDMAENGFDSEERVAAWDRRLREAMNRTLMSEADIEQILRDGLGALYARRTDHARLVKLHPGISRGTLERIKPYLRPELDKRILASANLIKLNRQEAKEQTLRRFSGWSTSIPAGGSDNVDKRAARKIMRRAIHQQPFVVRRLLIDQGHKMTAAINEVVALQGGAIAAEWRSHYRQPGYNYRVDHKERDGHIYLIPGNWALREGLMKAGPAGTIDDITKPGEEPFCRCYFVFVYSLRKLPENMLTVKGRAVIARGEARLHAEAASPAF
jgi:hypothetical protein